MKTPWIVAFLTLSSSSVMASIVPPRPVPLEWDQRFTNDMNRADFDAVLDRIEEIYAPTFERLGGYLSLEGLWESSRVDAHSSQVRDNWIVRVYGGVARHPAMTLDGLALVVCHEIGHHLAGFPQVSSWASTEGNADYYATQTCLKTIWNDDAWTGPRSGVSRKAQELCAEPGKWGSDFCVRSLEASYAVAAFLADLENTTISWDLPDATEVTTTNLSYPPVQCRFDTLIAGTFCERPSTHPYIPWTEKEMAATSCHASRNDQRGLRPRCWFQPRF